MTNMERGIKIRNMFSVNLNVLDFIYFVNRKSLKFSELTKAVNY